MNKKTTILEENTEENNGEETKDYKKHTSHGASVIGVDVVLEELKNACIQRKQKTMVSVGSGNGVLEWLFAQSNKEIEVVTVDPNPLDFFRGKPLVADNPTVFLPPQYPCVDELLQSRPELCGECVLLLNWPWPGERVTYDFDAIWNLRPAAIVVVCANGRTNWDAGGKTLQRWLSLCKWETKNGRFPCQRKYYRVAVDRQHDGVQCVVLFNDDGGSGGNLEMFNHPRDVFTPDNLLKCWETDPWNVSSTPVWPPFWVSAQSTNRESTNRA